MKVFLKVSQVEFKLLMRSFVTIFFSLVFPPMLVILFGSVYGNEPGTFFGNRGALDTMLPGYLSISICVIGLMNLPISISQYRQRKILKRYKATPLSPWTILVGQLLGSILLLLVSVVLVLLIASLFYNYSMDGSVGLFILTFVFTTINLFSIGFLIAAVARTEKGANLIANFIYFPMIFLSGSTFPAEMFPEKMLKVTRILPLTHGIALMKGVSFGEPFWSFGTELTVMAIWTAVCCIVAVRTFSWE